MKNLRTYMQEHMVDFAYYSPEESPEQSAKQSAKESAAKAADK